MFVNRIQRLNEVLHFGLGRQATTVDADKTYAYDLRGRKIYEGGATYPVRFAYDVFGNRTAMATYRDEAKGPDSGDVLCASNVRVIRK